MAQGQINVTICGGVTSDPQPNYLQSGQTVVNFSVASTPRKFDRNQNTWVDDEPTYIKCNAWGKTAENIASTFKKGMQVIVSGALRTSTFQDKNTGEKRSSIELRVEDAGPSLRWATAQVEKNPKSGGVNFNNNGFANNLSEFPAMNQNQPSQNQPSRNQPFGQNTPVDNTDLVDNTSFNDNPFTSGSSNDNPFNSGNDIDDPFNSGSSNDNPFNSGSDIDDPFNSESDNEEIPF